MDTLIDTLHRWAATAVVALLAGPCALAQGLSPNGLPLNPDSATRASNGPLDQLMAWERQDMGVRAAQELHTGAMHGPTPNTIPGGQVITTKGLLPLLQQGMAMHVLDALGGPQTLPNAIPAAWTAQPGAFDDQTQAQMARMLRQLTRGNTAVPLVFYCGGPQCWLSYNASLRAIQLGYRNVLWYRGGLEAWQRAGLDLVPARQQQPSPGQQPGAYPAPHGGGHASPQPPGAFPAPSM
ncbi:sulfurtransferase [Aquincola sp. S2]|uniref:Sulfurtransferase n=1 Tax=Pseudaquabacterium terrae TaxID=2732868 RepID=A0ABX2ESK7_9BURK|nr:rhodanese-like domain-containing protein [Aquabacterium terrae]NRF71616.1 sulfurtransferase [Aquabacterium terrae]